MASSNRSGKGGTGASAPPEDLIARLGLPVDARLIDRALTHRSYAYENGGLPTNERLEFLGDSVLGLVVTDTLYTTHSELPEGQLAKLRSAVVNSKALAEVARGLRLGDYVKLGRGEETTGGRDKASILADTLEALIGSVYLDHGIEVAFDLVRRLFGPLIATSATLGAGLDWKTSLQELTAVAGIGVPDYRVTETGPDHDKFFEADACVGGSSLRPRLRPLQEGSRAAGRRGGLAHHPRNTRGRAGSEGRPAGPGRRPQAHARPVRHRAGRGGRFLRAWTLREEVWGGRCGSVPAAVVFCWVGAVGGWVLRAFYGFAHGSEACGVPGWGGVVAVGSVVFSRSRARPGIAPRGRDACRP